MGAKSFPCPSYLYVDSAQGSDLASIFGDSRQREKLSEIKPSLVFILLGWEVEQIEDISANVACKLADWLCILKF